MKLDLYLPEGPGPFPAVVMIHGGAWAWGNKLNWQFHARRLARFGFVVVAPNYRLAPWHPFPAQLIDCRNAVRWTRKNASQWKIAPEQIGAFGYSAGGHLALLLAMNRIPYENVDPPPDALQGVDPAVQAVVAGGAPCDFHWLNDSSYLLWYWLRGTKRSAPHRFREATPADFYDESLKIPLFFYHAERDWLVPLDSAKRLHARTVADGNPGPFVVLPGKGHLQGFLFTPIVDQAAGFLSQHLNVQVK